VGVRIKDEFCDVNKKFTIQFEEGEYCNNNYECDSNVCVGNECISMSIFEKFLAWLSTLFG